MKKWKRCGWEKLRLLSVPVIGLIIMRHLPFYLCLLGVWAVIQVMRRRRIHLSVCADCTHKEDCRVGRNANNFRNGHCWGFIPKVLLISSLFLLRAMPLCMLAVCVPIIFCVGRKLRRLKKRCCKGADLNNLRGHFDSIRGQYRDILRMSWPQLADRLHQSPQARGGVPPTSVVGCAAIAASEGLAASVATIVALGESVAAELGVQIPVAVPVRAAPYAQQTRILKEMGFAQTPELQQLLVKHSGNIQAVITDVMQLAAKPKQQ